jgi:hypothetical protein
MNTLKIYRGLLIAIVLFPSVTFADSQTALTAELIIENVRKQMECPFPNGCAEFASGIYAHGKTGYNDSFRLARIQGEEQDSVRVDFTGQVVEKFFRQTNPTGVALQYVVDGGNANRLRRFPGCFNGDVAIPKTNLPPYSLTISTESAKYQWILQKSPPTGPWYLRGLLKPGLSCMPSEFEATIVVMDQQFLVQQLVAYQNVFGERLKTYVATFTYQQLGKGVYRPSIITFEKIQGGATAERDQVSFKTWNFVPTSYGDLLDLTKVANMNPLPTPGASDILNLFQVSKR